MNSARPSDTLVALLRGAGPILALTGAGVSAESSLATFRGPGGLWEGHNPAELATPEEFLRDPETVWRFYAWRRERAAAAFPNPGHVALAALDAAREKFHLVTQNVDGLHERAGSRRMTRLHGSLWRVRCTVEGTEWEDRRDDLGPLPPRCRCGALLRPGVVWFGEALPPEALPTAVRAARQARLLLVIGTSVLVEPAASIPMVALDAGAHVVEINPEETVLSRTAHERFAAPSGEVLPALLAAAGLTRAEAT